MSCCLCQRPQTFFLIVLFLGVVSPDAVVESGGKAQPGQVRRHQQSRSAADGIPRDHGGCHGPGEKDDLDECLNQAEIALKEHNDNYKQEMIFVLNIPILVCVPQKRWGSRPSSEQAAAHRVPVELQHHQ